MNFLVFRGFTWILWLRDRAKYQKPCFINNKKICYSHFKVKVIQGRAWGFYLHPRNLDGLILYRQGQSSTLSAISLQEILHKILSKIFSYLLTCSPRWSIGGLLFTKINTKLLHAGPTNVHKIIMFEQIISSHSLQCNITHPDLKKHRHVQRAWAILNASV